MYANIFGQDQFLFHGLILFLIHLSIESVSFYLGHRLVDKDRIVAQLL